MKTRKPVVVSKSTLVTIATCQEMVRLAFGNQTVIQEATIKFEDKSDAHNHMAPFKYVALWRLLTFIRINNQGSHKDKWLATLWIAQNQEGEWVKAQGWYLDLSLPERLPSQQADYVFHLNKDGTLQMIGR